MVLIAVYAVLHNSECVNFVLILIFGFLVYSSINPNDRM